MSYSVTIKGLKIFAYHGVNDEEKQSGQEFIFDVDLSINSKKGFITDDINSTVNYAQVKKAIEYAVTNTNFDLIEALGEYISKEIFRQFPLVKKVKLVIKKPDAPMSGDFDYVAVKLKRERKDYIE
ncbi:MAG: dihydroneopterin aldolase [Clostridia bacterium]|nr:dihydroneopterin aldolase [Clostridia bacterium]